MGKVRLVGGERPPVLIDRRHYPRAVAECRRAPADTAEQLEHPGSPI